MQPEAAIATALTERKNLFDKKTAFAGQIAGINNVCSSNYRSSPCHLFPVPCSLFPVLQNRLIRCARSPTFENPAKFRL